MKLIYVLIGFISLFLGLLGIILPILPTTPFLLLTLYCFSKGSERWNNWFISTKIYKNHLESFVENKAMTIKQKLSILFLADFMLAFPLVFSKSFHLRIFILFLIVCKFYYFIFKIETIKNTCSKE